MFCLNIDASELHPSTHPQPCPQPCPPYPTLALIVSKQSSSAANIHALRISFKGEVGEFWKEREWSLHVDERCGRGVVDCAVVGWATERARDSLCMCLLGKVRGGGERRSVGGRSIQVKRNDNEIVINE